MNVDPAELDQYAAVTHSPRHESILNKESAPLDA